MQLRQALENRKSIERPKGILMKTARECRAKRH
jgi:AmiR/NasT family two-component response regulator